MAGLSAVLARHGPVPRPQHRDPHARRGSLLAAYVGLIRPAQGRGHALQQVATDAPLGRSLLRASSPRPRCSPSSVGSSGATAREQ